MHRTTEELEAALEDFRSAPSTVGAVELVVARPANGERAVLGRVDPRAAVVA